MIIQITIAPTLATAGMGYPIASFQDLKGFAAIRRHLSTNVEKCLKTSSRQITHHRLSEMHSIKYTTLTEWHSSIPMLLRTLKGRKLKKTFLITTFNPHSREWDKIVERNWDLLDKFLLHTLPTQTRLD